MLLFLTTWHDWCHYDIYFLHMILMDDIRLSSYSSAVIYDNMMNLRLYFHLRGRFVLRMSAELLDQTGLGGRIDAVLIVTISGMFYDIWQLRIRSELTVKLGMMQISANTFENFFSSPKWVTTLLRCDVDTNEYGQDFFILSKIGSNIVWKWCRHAR